VAREEVLFVLGPGGGLDQERCPLLDVLLAKLRRRGPLAADASSNHLADLFLVLHRVSEAEVSEDVRVGYLLRAIASDRADQKRRLEGRPRCGICRHYGWVSRRCLHRDAVHTAELAPQVEPGRLVPPCPHFRSMHALPSGELPSPLARTPSETERVGRALEQLRASRPAAWRLLVLHHIDGLSLRELSRRSGCDRRVLARRMRSAETELGALLEDLA
jgi:DNA-directed RNA polymerase specialized sigma24 family protein